uniref:Uncharacterized protein n=1 Tax=Romanomermis culicivorax TaxID=13658 RepID=A0A915KIA3_ROMCU
MNEAEDFAIRIGMVNLADKSWDYVRDTTWPNIKKATITNVDKYNQTVAGPGSTMLEHSIFSEKSDDFFVPR